MPADCTFRMQQHAVSLQRPFDRVRAPRLAALAGDLRDQVVLEPEALRQRAQAVDYLVRRPARHQRRDARGQLLVEHPVGEELRVVGRDECRGGRVDRQQQAVFVRARQVDVDHVAQSANSGDAAQPGDPAQPGHAAQAKRAVDRRKRADQPGTRAGRDEGFEAIAARLHGAVH
jgi:hypothetical protein